MHRGSTFLSFETQLNEQEDNDETQDPNYNMNDLLEYPPSPTILTKSPAFSGERHHAFSKRRRNDSSLAVLTGQGSPMVGDTPSRSTTTRRALLPPEDALFEVTQLTSNNANSGSINEEVLSELKSLKSDVASLKRDFKTMAEKQLEVIQLVKAIKKGCESSQFDLGKCCHTDNVNNIIGQFYCLKGRFPFSDDGKKKLLEDEFDQSPTGLSIQELSIRCSKYEQSKFSYWRSEERRRLLAIAGYNALETMATQNITSKILQLVGQKYNASSAAALNKEIILTRKFIRETTLAQARKLKDFWGSFYQWKLENWSHVTREEWQTMRREDQAVYTDASF